MRSINSYNLIEFITIKFLIKLGIIYQIKYINYILTIFFRQKNIIYLKLVYNNQEIKNQIYLNIQGCIGTFLFHFFIDIIFSIF